MERFVHEGSQADTAVSRPVTERSRITGVDRSTEGVHAPSEMAAQTRTVDWAAIVASVVTGVAISAMLVILGIATGLISGSEGTNADEAQGILGAVGAWTVVAACLGTLAGSLLGGRLARRLDRGSVGYHALTSWGLATLLSLVLVTLVSIGFATAANSAANATTAAETVVPGDQAAAGGNAQAGAAAGQGGQAAGGADEAADDTADALGGAGLALSLGMLLTLAVSVAGWWVGSRKRLLEIEREPGRSAA